MNPELREELRAVLSPRLFSAVESAFAEYERWRAADTQAISTLCKEAKALHEQVESLNEQVNLLASLMRQAR